MARRRCGTPPTPQLARRQAQTPVVMYTLTHGILRKQRQQQSSSKANRCIHSSRTMAPLRLWGLALLSLGAVAHAANEAEATTTSSSSESDSKTSSSLSSSSSSSSADTSTSTSGVVVLTGTHTSSEAVAPTSTHVSTTITLAGTTSIHETGLPTVTDNGTETESAMISVATLTLLTGSIAITTTSTTTLAGNFTVPITTTTAAAPSATNTQPCNNYVELCERKYSNITQVGCHNSPFVQKGSAAANQALDVTDQLNDGVRFLQGQMHWPDNGTEPHFCHTTCELLDAGPITEWLTKVKTWVAANRFEVVTILLENGNYSNPSLYVPYIQSTGILDYVYTPPYQPMNVTTWPTLAEMIIYNTRVVMFLDYEANQTAYPWWIDEFSNMWETPFDPTDNTFPCTIQRPDGLSVEDGKNILYLSNHNLNVEVSLLGTSLLVPDVSSLNTTNNVTGVGSLGAAANTCIATFDRPPTVLNVDYYNYGGTYDSGAVFKVAAAMNNVTYTGTCCGTAATSAGSPTAKGPSALFWYEGQRNDRRSVAMFLTLLTLWLALVW
ncbi:PLC-like phosphodiesterase [Coniella lustricola]|uniref:PLC-like phosphodiesterase n=1 Tax=Coniella lustricola TaxID=2025994 RepID=A0A2T3A7C4_9PEZI|nr:PLC-like phosphodiesterase [Coniella lustricola]